MDSTSRLQSAILREIEAAGPIPFARYMDLCLYHSELGYYTCGRGGGSGRDYVTSSGLHRAYGALLARQAEEMWAGAGEPEHFRFVEFGPGEGYFACDVLRAAAARPRFARALEYVLVEASPVLAARQRERIRTWAASADAEAIATTWTDLAGLEARGPEQGCLFANEVLDAFPVHRVIGTASGPLEVHVAARDGVLVEILAPLSSLELSRFIDESAIRLEEGQEVDLNLTAPRFIGRLGRLMGRGYLVVVDYGYAAPELYHPGRRRGTLLAYHRHRATEEFLLRPGEQDLTAHVDFTAVTRAAAAAGLRSLGITTQARFLLALGALDFMENAGLEEREALKSLVLPDRMGGVFRVLVFAKGDVPDHLRGLGRPWAASKFPGEPGEPPRSGTGRAATVWRGTF